MAEISKIDGFEKIRNGDTITPRVDAGPSDALLTDDFSRIDSAFDANLAHVLDAVSVVFETTYTIPTTNQRPDGSYPIHVPVDLRKEAR